MILRGGERWKESEWKRKLFSLSSTTHIHILSHCSFHHAHFICLNRLVLISSVFRFCFLSLKLNIYMCVYIFCHLVCCEFSFDKTISSSREKKRLEKSVQYINTCTHTYIVYVYASFHNNICFFSLQLCVCVFFFISFGSFGYFVFLFFFSSSSFSSSHVPSEIVGTFRFKNSTKRS